MDIDKRNQTESGNQIANRKSAHGNPDNWALDRMKNRQAVYEYEDLSIQDSQLVKCDIFLNVDENLLNHVCELERGAKINTCLYKVLLDYSSDPIFCLDQTGRFIYVNIAFSVPRLSDDVIGKKIWDVFPGEEGLPDFDLMKSVFRTGKMKVVEVHAQRNDSLSYFMTSINPIKDSCGEVIMIMCISKDITDRKLAEEALKEREYLLRESQKAAHIGSYVYDLKTEIWKGSDELDLIYGIDQEYPRTYQGWLRIIHPDFLTEVSAYFKKVEKDKSPFHYEYKIIRPSDSSERWVQDIRKWEFDENAEATRMFGTVQDVTDRKKVEKEIVFLSYHDKLTGLYNRRFYEEEIKRMDTENNLPISIIMGDVNGLKLVNDAFGHDKGDELLLKCAAALKKACCQNEIIVRLGGDEFLVLLPRTEGEEAKQVIDRIKSHYAKESVNGLSISISFGSDTKRRPEEDIFKIQKNAEDYMYNLKIIEKESMRGKIIKSLVDTFYGENRREELHAKRVSEISSSIGKAIGLSPNRIKQLEMAGMLHDIGKIALDSRILNKQEALTEQEKDELKRHPDIGYRILSSSYDMLDLADYVYAHHEKWDGSGYPKGLKGEKIPLISRIIAIAESYDVLTNPVSYKSCLSSLQAIEELKQKSGTDFDPEIVKIFVEKIL
ncbi:diguanylate cyclase and metal dependent phosphohydrolase [Syntrophobotulus glycolicus DSM 8271]|uniref:Diguanylate cyclase and metal dependent phosphohydrolase n=1 Tax=Syntrophobotulus glycolicus (strain DSM 8271 / FlGlyR) TaxID=645991 RepID=F0SYW5_SYNGF|nr:HD domain-containing phosphohydrolase [Syntrophobotulus glycolicus]ADY56002.1 diguanylate cyclase and metal dependent phosphohydrolase [Syntrophobotulus glycolicus DSM 8271]